MRRFLLLLAGCLLFPLGLCAQTEIDWTLPGDRIGETEGRGLVVRSNPSGARVFIDGIERGRTPLRLENLRPGRYFVRLERDGYVERRFRVTVRQGSVTDVSLELHRALGRVLLKIQPAPGSPPASLLSFSPRISVDGYIQQSYALELPVGFRTILVRAFGWEDISTTLFIEENSLRELNINLKPAPFTLSGGSLNRQSFNPANAGTLGTTTLQFEASAPGRGNFAVLNREGEAVFTRQLGHFESWHQTVVWNGRNMQGEQLPDGTYTLAVSAVSLPWDDSPAIEENLTLTVKLDSSKMIYPLTLSSGKSGLLFAPFPSLLPPSSFQVEGSLLAGAPMDTSPEASPWSSLPFSAGFRFSPLERLEVSAALNVLPRFEGKAGAGVSGGAKWVFVRPREGNLPLGAAAGAVFSWTGNTGLTPFGMASGVELFFPFSVDFGRLFSFAVSPAALWTADEGFPWEPAPRLLVSGGLMMRTTYISAGLSLRSEYDFTASPWPPFIAAGGEIKFSPPPSSFVFSLMGGLWKRGNSAGGFGGFGIGMIY